MEADWRSVDKVRSTPRPPIVAATRGAEPGVSLHSCSGSVVWTQYNYSIISGIDGIYLESDRLCDVVFSLYDDLCHPISTAHTQGIQLV